MGDTDHRLFHHPDGSTYRVRLGPPASPGGNRIRSMVLTFERPDGVWVGSVSIRPHTRLARLREEELIENFQAAVGGRTSPSWRARVDPARRGESR